MPEAIRIDEFTARRHARRSLPLWRRPIEGALFIVERLKPDLGDVFNFERQEYYPTETHRFLGAEYDPTLVTAEMKAQWAKYSATVKPRLGHNATMSKRDFYAGFHIARAYDLALIQQTAAELRQEALDRMRPVIPGLE